MPSKRVNPYETFSEEQRTAAADTRAQRYGRRSKGMASSASAPVVRKRSKIVRKRVEAPRSKHAPSTPRKARISAKRKLERPTTTPPTTTSKLPRDSLLGNPKFLPSKSTLARVDGLIYAFVAERDGLNIVVMKVAHSEGTSLFMLNQYRFEQLPSSGRIEPEFWKTNSCVKVKVHDRKSFIVFSLDSLLYQVAYDDQCRFEDMEKTKKIAGKKFLQIVLDVMKYDSVQMGKDCLAVLYDWASVEFLGGGIDVLNGDMLEIVSKVIGKYAFGNSLMGVFTLQKGRVNSFYEHFGFQRYFEHDAQQSAQTISAWLQSTESDTANISKKMKALEELTFGDIGLVAMNRRYNCPKSPKTKLKPDDASVCPIQPQNLSDAVTYLGKLGKIAKKYVPSFDIELKGVASQKFLPHASAYVNTVSHAFTEAISAMPSLNPKVKKDFEDFIKNRIFFFTNLAVGMAMGAAPPNMFKVL